MLSIGLSYHSFRRGNFETLSDKPYLLGLIYDFNLLEQNVAPLPPAFTFPFCRTWSIVLPDGCIGC